MELKELKKIASELKAQFNLGKNGITDSFIDTVRKYAEAHTIVKVKCTLAEDKDSLKYYANEVAKLTELVLVETRGFTFTLAKN
jgi:RNA-binding protein YhbY